MIRGDFCVALVCTFIGGYAAHTQVQEWKEEQVQKETAEQVRKCQAYVGYLVIALDGRTTECRALQPRLDIVIPYQGDPLRLKRREIRQAIHSEPKGKS